jgi:hypothetical protein
MVVAPDVLIRVEDRNVFIAECKIWDGPAKFREAGAWPARPGPQRI